MKLNLVALTALLGLSTAFSFSTFSAAIAQNPPAETYRPGFWQPVADFNPMKKVTMKFINQTGVPLEYGIVGNEENLSEKIGVGETQTLSTLEKSGNITIYPDIAINPDTPFNLKFSISVDQPTNTINVKITQAERGFFGHRSLNFQKTGKIYVY
ncbi:MAG: hypothetical protein VKJ02_05175 [Snowella sp.]|nr:hypothetical protein [Snowella sp.]